MPLYSISRAQVDQVTRGIWLFIVITPFLLGARTCVTEISFFPAELVNGR